MLPRSVEIRIEQRIGKVASKMIFDLSLRFSFKMFKYARLSLGGQAVFRGKAIAGGPQALLEFGY